MKECRKRGERPKETSGTQIMAANIQLVTGKEDNHAIALWVAIEKRTKLKGPAILDCEQYLFCSEVCGEKHYIHEHVSMTSNITCKQWVGKQQAGKQQAAISMAVRRQSFLRPCYLRLAALYVMYMISAKMCCQNKSQMVMSHPHRWPLISQQNRPFDPSSHKLIHWLVSLEKFSTNCLLFYSDRIQIEMSKKQGQLDPVKDALCPDRLDEMGQTGNSHNAGQGKKVR